MHRKSLLLLSLSLISLAVISQCNSGNNPTSDKKSYTIVASATTGGTIDPSGSVRVDSAASKTFTYSPAAGGRLDSVVVDGVKLPLPGTSYTFVNVITDHTIKAWFSGGGVVIDTTADTTAKQLSITTPFGISYKNEHLQSGESKVEGTIGVYYDGNKRLDAKVEVNGISVPRSSSPVSSGYDLDGMDDLIVPGDSVTIIASITSPAIAETISVLFPALFQITSPAEGSTTAQPPFTVSWSPAVAIVPSFTFVPAPVAGQYAAKDKIGTYSRLGTGDWFKKLTMGQTQVELTDVSVACDESIIEVRMSSAFVVKNASSVICYLHRRISQKGLQ